MSHENDTNADSGFDPEVSAEDDPLLAPGRSPESDAATDAGIELDHVTVENDNAPNECAVFPRAASEEELLTNWIAAHEGGYVDLESMR